MFSEKVSGVASLRELVASVAGPRSWTDTRESWLARAARKAGISYRQCKALFYGEISDPHHRSARLMRDAAERLEASANRMEASDPDFFGAHIAAHRQAARDLRRSIGQGSGGVEPDGGPDRAGDDCEG